MKRFAVGYYNAYDNELTVEIVEAADWKEAAAKHSKGSGHGPEDWPDTLEELKEEFFNQDAGIDVVEIPA